MGTLEILTKRTIIKCQGTLDQIPNKEKLSKRTHSKESATRKKVDKKLVDLGWIIDEENPNCNVFTERAKTEEQNQKFNGVEPDYVLYKSGTDIPIAIIETKRKGEDLEKALRESKEKYAIPLGVKIIFAFDGGLLKTQYLDEEKELSVNNISVTDFLTELELLKFVNGGVQTSLMKRNKIKNILEKN